MKKGFLSLALFMAMATVIPASAFAHESSTVTSQHDDDFVVFKLYVDGKYTLPTHGPYKGEDENPFTWDKADGTQIRFFIKDIDQMGMSISIIDSNGNPVSGANGSTNKNNGYQFLKVVTLPNEGDYIAKVWSDNGDGGYEYEIAVRAIN
ncbi:hypothetical protein M3650_15265 [Paenibacillus sp. MER TA 81-3]|uniref:hypothetical protein n=1 Tax=Paenibacillus sp. MER TA 81-3 TaxID=2939573 RepID=UPI00203FE3BB|nr:hypothetical protein [Paenibacillus sp. MER TA 81-3]MCM3339954.1 hypothetical protein [Paenibacillus sp. MER TA 81-3]